MRRKLIKQGGTGLTFYVPKKWIDSKKLKAGDQVELTPLQGDLLLSPVRDKKEKKEISLKIKKSRQSVHRSLLVNAYRAGFDKLIVHFKGKEEELFEIVEKFMMGFELYKKREEVYVIESMSEPDLENFESMLLRLFYVVEQVLEDPFSKHFDSYSVKIQKYENFLKRCISKQHLNETGAVFLWNLLTNLTQVVKMCYHLKRDVKKMNSVLEKELFAVKEMFVSLREAYTKKDFSTLWKVYEDNEVLYLRNIKKLKRGKESIQSAHVLLIDRAVYLCISPLVGYLQMRSFRE